ncbi:MAG: hypothetical protein FJ091_20260 [Deltaproteobacteria bacterium]|nr:hypothetical protein [Deltaproteobacteria bacterium]
MNARGATWWALMILGVAFVANGLTMLFVPEPWFARVAAATGAFNPHLVRDVGVAYAASGIAALWAARTPAWRAPLAAMSALFQAGHALIHVFDVLTGALPPFHLIEDFPVIYLPSAILVVIALRSREPERA